MTNVTEPNSLHGNDQMMDRLAVRRYVEKALKEKFDYPTKEELRKRIPNTVTKRDLDSAIKSLESEGKIMVDENDGRIIWIAPENEIKSLRNYVPLD